MERNAFKMKRKPGFDAGYKQRRDEARLSRPELCPEPACRIAPFLWMQIGGFSWLG